MNDRKAAYVNEEPPTLTAILAALRDDLKAFFQTRFQMLAAELRQKVAAWKMGALALSIAFVFAFVGFLLLTGALVSIAILVFGVSLALLIVGVFYLILAAGAAWAGYTQLKRQGVPPERTLQMLKEDQTWLQNQTKSA
jgi:uncharacterized membrane protein YqjE